MKKSWEKYMQSPRLLSDSICQISYFIRIVTSDKVYRYDLDLLKGLAIIAVVLYHAGWCKSGYLGVDVFFVLNGYFIINGSVSRITAPTTASFTRTATKVTISPRRHQSIPITLLSIVC